MISAATGRCWSILRAYAQTEDPVERLGVDLAWATLREADLVIWMDEEGREPDWAEAPRRVLKLLSKADCAECRRPDGWLAISSQTGAGIDRLLAAVSDVLRDALPAADLIAPATERQRHHLVAAIAACTTAVANWNEMPTEILSEELRGAAFALGRIVGQVGPEELLDEVFGRFCIGK